MGPYLSKAATKMLNEVEQLLQEQNSAFKKETVTKFIVEYTKSHQMLFMGS
jgi:hypothetical protein